ncbi:hypothetical protein [Microbispora sp. NPDC049633]|uniref:hypothetical protein n=1 Tax=Microbispora sp. NPDC049633 TaxID=3154355 RepID=UPI0034126A1C
MITHDAYVTFAEGKATLHHLDCKQPVCEVDEGARLNDLRATVDEHVTTCRPGATDSPEIRLVTDYNHNFGRVLDIWIYKLADGEPTHVLRYEDGMIERWDGLDDTSVKPDPTLRVPHLMASVELYGLREYVTGTWSHEGDLDMSQETFDKAASVMLQLWRMRQR